MSRVIEAASGAQLLPNVGDARAISTGWTAHCATNADLRTKHEAWKKIAGRFLIVPDETRES